MAARLQLHFHRTNRTRTVTTITTLAIWFLIAMLITFLIGGILL